MSYIERLEKIEIPIGGHLQNLQNPSQDPFAGFEGGSPRESEFFSVNDPASKNLETTLLTTDKTDKSPFAGFEGGSPRESEFFSDPELGAWAHGYTRFNPPDHLAGRIAELVREGWSPWNAWAKARGERP